MNLLAVDTSTENLSFCITCNGRVAVNINRRLRFGASKLIEYIGKYRRYFKALDALAVGAGPGSFTGLRISFSVVKALSMALNKPVIKIGSFFSVASVFKNKYDRIAVIADARRNMIYCGLFDKNIKKKGNEKLMSFEQCLEIYREHFFVTYDEHLRKQALDKYPGISFYPKDVYPDVKHALSLAQEYYNEGKFTALEKLEPVYLHPKTCQIRKVIKNEKLKMRNER